MTNDKRREWLHRRVLAAQRRYSERIGLPTFKFADAEEALDTVAAIAEKMARKVA